MDLRCERCQTEYEVEDAKVSDLGTEVQCSECGHRFVAKRPSDGEAKPPGPDEWLLETVAGQSHRLQSSFLLQKWIIEGRLNREDRASHNGQPWKPLGEIDEMAPFFAIVDDAARADAAPTTPVPVLSPSMPVLAPPTRPEAAGLPARAASPVAGRPEGGAPTERPAAPASLSSSLPSPADSLGGVNLGAFPQASDPGETEIIRVGSRKSHGFLKLMLTMLVAAAVAYAGIAWQHRRLRSAVISSSGTAEDESLRDHARASDPAARAPADDAEPAQAPGRDDSMAPRGPLVEPMAESGRAEGAARGGKRVLAMRKPKAEAGRAIRPISQPSRAQPGAPEALAAQGYAALTHHQYPQAIGLFKRALVGRPSNGTALFGLAEAYRASGQKMAALLTYRRYVDAFPAGPNAIAARTQVRLLEGKKR